MRVTFDRGVAHWLISVDPYIVYLKNLTFVDMHMENSLLDFWKQLCVLRLRDAKKVV